MARTPKSTPTKKPDAGISEVIEAPASAQEAESPSKAATMQGEALSDASSPLPTEEGLVTEEGSRTSTPFEAAKVESSPIVSPPAAPSFLRFSLLALLAGGLGGVATSLLLPQGISYFGGVSSQASQAVIAPPPSQLEDLLKARDDKQAALEARLQGEITKLAASIAAFQQSSSSQSSAPQAPQTPADAPRLAELEAKLAALQSALGKLEQASAALTRSQIAASRLNALKQLAAAFEAGQPLKAALEPLQAYGFTQEQLQPFFVFATVGAPSSASLSQELASLRAKTSASRAEERALADKQAAEQLAQDKAANTPSTPSTGPLERFWTQADDAFAQILQKAAGLIEIRSLKDKAAKPDSDALARAVMQGDDAAIRTALEALPEAEKTAFAAFRQQVEAIINAREALRKHLQTAEEQVRANPLPLLP